MTRLAACVVGAALLVVVLGCAATQTRMAARVPSIPVVLRLTKTVPCRTGHETLAGPAAVRRFHAVTAVECHDGQRIYPGSGQWSVRVRSVAVSSVANLQRYFEQHSVTKYPKNLICTANLVVLNVPVFVDAQRHSLVPETPVDACHHPLGYAEYGKGSMSVRWRVVSVHRVRLMVSAPALAANCAMQIKNLMYGWVAPTDQTNGGPLFEKTPRKAGVCIYRTPADDLEVGNFVRGFSLTASQTSRLLSAMTGAAPSGPCPDQRTFALIHASSGLEAPVELGGCWRVARPYPNHGVGGADSAVIRSILGSRLTSSAPCVGSCFWDRQGRLDSLAGYATRVAGAAHVFAGVRIDDPANRVILFLVHAPQSVIAQIRKGHGDTYVIHNDAPRTLHEVVALQNSLDWATWKAQGVHIVSTGPTQTGYLQVGVTSNVARAQALFDAAYPSGVIRVVHDEPGMPTSLTGPTG